MFTEESETGLELIEKPLNHSYIEFQSEAIFGKNSFEVIADDENNFQTSIKGSSRTIPEDSIDDPGRVFTEESEIGLELHEKPLNHSLIEFQSEVIFDENSFEVIADDKNKFQTSIKGSWPQVLIGP